MKKIYQVLHSYDDDNGCDHTKLIGHFSSEALAKEAVEVLKKKQGFSDHPDGFFIGLAAIDVIHWEEGFVSM